MINWIQIGCENLFTLKSKLLKSQPTITERLEQAFIGLNQRNLVTDHHSL